MSMNLFTGFSKETFAFLKELEKNNNKEWFGRNKERFMEFVELPSISFMHAMCGAMAAKFKDLVRLQPKLFRIYRDIRFSSDKRPYKTHIGILFSESMRSGCAAPVFYAHIGHNSLSLVTGLKDLKGEIIERFRRSVDDDKSSRTLVRILDSLTKNGFVAEGEKYKAVPRGYDKSHPREGLLRSKGLYVERQKILPREIYGPEFIRFCLNDFTSTKELYDWFKDLA